MRPCTIIVTEDFPTESHSTRKTESAANIRFIIARGSLAPANCCKLLQTEINSSRVNLISTTIFAILLHLFQIARDIVVIRSLLTYTSYNAALLSQQVAKVRAKRHIIFNSSFIYILSFRL